jgi:hypothetical protein
MSAALLPRDIILPLAAVQEIMPEIAAEIATGENATTVGNPAGTRVVTFATADGAHLVVLSVDQYRGADDASSAFQEALRITQEVPGIKAEAVADLGDAALIGIATQGDVTNIGGGALFGDLIVIATLQAFEGTDTDKAAVAELIRRQAEHAGQTLQSGTPATGRAYLAIRQYQFAPGRTMDELAAAVASGFMPIVREVPGFLDYSLVETDEGPLSISVFTDQAGAEESTRRAAGWVQQNIADIFAGPPTVTTGSVWLHEAGVATTGTPAP